MVSPHFDPKEECCTLDESRGETAFSSLTLLQGNNRDSSCMVIFKTFVTGEVLGCLYVYFESDDLVLSTHTHRAKNSNITL